MEELKASKTKVLIEGGQGEIMEKKSRFIADVRKVESEEEATAFIEEIKKKYWDARHHCSAFVIGQKGQLTRCSDDGEPSGTAGRPMLEVLLGEGICDIAVVVTRYFGGVLLGTGGLVRAYSAAVKEGLKNCVTGYRRLGTEIEVQTDYTGLGKLQYLLASRQISPIGEEYGADVKLRLLIPAEEAEDLRTELTDALNGRIGWEKLEERYYIEQ
jgi:YigZ family protein